MSPTFDFLVKTDKIYVTYQYFGEIPGTLPTKTASKGNILAFGIEILEGKYLEVVHKYLMEPHHNQCFPLLFSSLLLLASAFVLPLLMRHF